MEPLAIQVDIHKTRWKAGRISYSSCHPFTVAARSAIGARNPVIVIRGVLEEYYDLVQPAICSEVIDLQGRRNISFEFSLERHNIPWPWDLRPVSIEPESTPIFHDGQIVFRTSAVHGTQHWGPVSEEKIDTEARKLADLMVSIDRYGYVVDGGTSDSFIRGYIMRKATDWVCVIDQGQHRAGVLCGLGYKKIPVYITKVIDYFDLQHFPKVKDGLYSLEEARGLFDSMLAGKPVPALAPWLSETDTQNHRQE